MRQSSSSLLDYHSKESVRTLSRTKGYYIIKSNDTLPLQVLQKEKFTLIDMVDWDTGFLLMTACSNLPENVRVFGKVCLFSRGAIKIFQSEIYLERLVIGE